VPVANHADSKLDCFILFGDQTAHHLRERFALGLTTAAVDAHLERLILSSTGSNYTRLYDTFQYYRCAAFGLVGMKLMIHSQGVL
jgi:hypothetical protein